MKGFIPLGVWQLLVLAYLVISFLVKLPLLQAFLLTLASLAFFLVWSMAAFFYERRLWNKGIAPSGNRWMLTRVESYGSHFYISFGDRPLCLTHYSPPDDPDSGYQPGY